MALLNAMLLIVAAVQGFILGAILFFNKRGLPRANRTLAALLTVFSLILIEEGLEATGWQLRYPRIKGVGFLLDLMLGALTLLYAEIIRRLGKVEPPTFWYHLALPLAVNLIYIPYHFSVDWDMHLINSAQLSSLYTTTIITKLVYQFIYQVLSIRLLTIFIRHNRNTKARSFRWIAKWLRNMLIGALILIPVILAMDLTGLAAPFDSDFLTSIIMLVSIYSVGYAALVNPLVYPRGVENLKGPGAEKAKYQSSSLTEVNKRNFANELQESMVREKLYLNPDLSFDDLANHLNIPGHHLSQILNEVLRQNFYDFVNAYRVEAVKSRMEQNVHASNTLLSIGLSVGFNSKATFNRAFKKETGQTPKAFAKTISRQA